MQLGDNENAKHHFKQTAALQPNNSKAYINLGLIEWQNDKNSTKARHYLQKALQFTNDSVTKNQIHQLMSRLPLN